MAMTYPSLLRPARQLLVALSLGAIAALAGCDKTGPGDDSDQIDTDADGFTPADGDCDDSHAQASPDQIEACDGIDNDCDGVVDDGYDRDDDGFTSCAGDCRDNDATTFPGAFEQMDGLDNDCDRQVDNHTATYDDDGDGYSEAQGDCNDDPQNDGGLVGPQALEVGENADGQPEGIDNDCDGLIDEPIEPCPATSGDLGDPMTYALALDVCHEVVSASWAADRQIDPRSRNVVASYGDTYRPHAGPDFAALSTGLALDAAATGWVPPVTGTRFINSLPHPAPGGLTTCQGDFGPEMYDDPATVNDYSELRLALAVPTNAHSLAFDFNFMSSEFPQFVCTTFDDTFVAYLESSAFTGNVSFDDNGNRVSINIGFFDVCSPMQSSSCSGDEELEGTGFRPVAHGGLDSEPDGGGTGWLTTISPVTPGEKIILTFMIWDEGDHIYDSLVLLDNFRWGLEAVDGPTTVERVTDGRFVAAPGAGVAR
jgi:hypothetical protein